MDNIKKNNFFGNKFISDCQMSDNSVIDIEANKIEIEVDKIEVDKIDKIDVDKNDVDKIDFDKIDVGKIDFDEIDIDKNDKIDIDDVDKIFTFDDIDDVPHNGKLITTIEISPNENYLVTYSEEDRSVVGWNVEVIEKVQLKFHQTVKVNEDYIISLCVSDDKKLAYIDYAYERISGK
jgi:hypothetical protein